MMMARVVAKLKVEIAQRKEQESPFWSPAPDYLDEDTRVPQGLPLALLPLSPLAATKTLL